MNFLAKELNNYFILTTLNKNLENRTHKGSVIAPLFLNIYIIPLFQLLHKYSNIKYHTYVDDIHIYLYITEPSTDILTINKYIYDIQKWRSHNSLCINRLNTETIHIRNPKQSLTIIKHYTFIRKSYS